MGQQIIRQPDGRLAVFDTVSDTFIVVDATPEEVIEWRAEEAADTARSRTRDELNRVATTERPYRQFTLTWAEAASRHARNSTE
ncbi:hypothetical protein [Streptomyces sp. enrichment culture]|uniref:hypothetical protein n=1 Tax=Streptomyces sp. enrichment culture TaxID=1795815 RepID=UPI003F546682